MGREMLFLMLTIGALLGCGRQKTFGDLDKELAADQLCAHLLRGDYAAASEPIQRKTARHKLTVGSTINWLAREVKTPYVEIPPSQLFQELPRDQGILKSCRSGGLTLMGDQILKPLYLQYDQSRLTVMLRYSNPAAPKLQFIEIGGVEKTFPGQEDPDAFQKRMSDFKRTLDQMEHRR